MGVARKTEVGSEEFEAGMRAGLREAAIIIRQHLAWLIERYGESSPQAHGARLDLFCVERRLRLETMPTSAT